MYLHCSLSLSLSLKHQQTQYVDVQVRFGKAQRWNDDDLLESEGDVLMLNVRKSASGVRRRNVKFSRSERWVDKDDDDDKDILVLNYPGDSGGGGSTKPKIGHTFRKSERWNNDDDEGIYDY